MKKKVEENNRLSNAEAVRFLINGDPKVLKKMQDNELFMTDNDLFRVISSVNQREMKYDNLKALIFCIDFIHEDKDTMTRDEINALRLKALKG